MQSKKHDQRRQAVRYQPSAFSQIRRGCVNEILRRQFARSWQVVTEAMAAFTPDEWTTGEVDYLTPARLAYHIVEVAEFYTSDTSYNFPWGHRFGCDREGTKAEELPDRDAVAAYLAEVRDQVEHFLSQDLLSEDPDFPWCGGTRLDRALYLVRHTTTTWASCGRRSSAAATTCPIGTEHPVIDIKAPHR
jgi:hypothetical protein